jgi:hypothetical protein
VQLGWEREQAGPSKKKKTSEIEWSQPEKAPRDKGTRSFSQRRNEKRVAFEHASLLAGNIALAKPKTKQKNEDVETTECT